MTGTYGGWSLSEPINGIKHFIPVNDTHDHMDADCPCHPEPDEECPEIMVHNSFDGREEFEAGARLPS